MNNIAGLNIGADLINPNPTRQAQSVAQNISSEQEKVSTDKGEHFDGGKDTREAITDATKRNRDTLAKEALIKQAFTTDSVENLGARDSLSDFRAAKFEDSTIDTNPTATTRKADREAARQNLASLQEKYQSDAADVVAAQANTPSKELVTHLLA